ncbi:MAG TPA: tRNA glutamyl-Q(34) synthetase GluQRS [Oleiagrimonas sp.]|nr:tRNA glutamyl-Q(34) synthetase GluQRS [Oleiagrimonas sp.]
MPRSPYRGRFAPSPTGDLHAGSLVAALAGWLRARQAGGQWLLRMEDIDPLREVDGSAQSILADLQRLGLIADGAVMYQSTRHAAYQAALDVLHDKGLIFPCWCSRADLATADGIHRDGHCVRPADSERAPALRLQVPDTTIAFDDMLQGPQRQNLRDTVGDIVLRRADGCWAYQLACVVDDAAQGVTEVVRGVDLMTSTPRQIHLQHLLDLPTPRYLHIPLVTDRDGRKLSKSNLDRPLDGRPVAVLLRAALVCLGVPVENRPEGNIQGLLESAVRHFDIARLEQVGRLSFALP